ncbi:hypothetical protein [Streptomyces sp. NPDC017988]|uniref:hypothetical protein n=1 Tax=Streptomyces sp. NPDC017988 TaxID=3365025 RepID=UPI00378D4B64
MFEARDRKLCMGLELYADAQDDPTEVVDLDDAVLPAALDAFAELLRPEEGARLVVGLGQPQAIL